MRTRRWNTSASLSKPLAAAILLLALAYPAGAGAAQHLDYKVLAPPGYHKSQREYPVVYIVPGSGEDPTSAAQTLRLEDYAARDEAIIVVASEVGDGQSNFIVDWFDGSKPLDRSFTRELIDEVDGRYRTIADGRHRAIAGYSAGGYSAMAVASRHPRLFASAASFSGVTNLLWRGHGGALAFEGANTLFYGPNTAFRRWGNPVTNHANWKRQNPASLADRLSGKRGLYIAAGDGTPESAEEAAAAGPFLAAQSATERITGEMTQSYHRKLRDAGVAHVYRPHAGLHRSSHWREDLARWWPMAIKALRRPGDRRHERRRGDGGEGRRCETSSSANRHRPGRRAGRGESGRRSHSHGKRSRRRGDRSQQPCHRDQEGLPAESLAFPLAT